MKKITILLLAMGLLISSSFSMAATPVPLDRVVAVVNDDVITMNTLNTAMGYAKQQYAKANRQLPPTQRLREQVLDSLIYKELQMQLAKKLNVEIDDNTLNEAITNIAKGNNKTLAELKKSIEKDGLNYSDFRKQIREQLTMQQIQRRAIGRDINVSDQELNDAMAEYRRGINTASDYHILDVLIPLPSAPSAEQLQTAQKKADSILQKLKDGTNITQFAPSDLGWRKLPELPTLFAENVTGKNKADNIGPIRAGNGLHILHVADKRHAGNSMTRAQIHNILVQRKFEEHLEQWLTELRESAFVNIMLDDNDAKA